MSLLGHYDKAKWFYSLARKNGRDDALISMCIIENALLAQNDILARSELTRAFNRFPVAYFFTPLTGSLGQKFREVPLDENLLFKYIRSELHEVIDNYLFPVGHNGEAGIVPDA